MNDDGYLVVQDFLSKAEHNHYLNVSERVYQTALDNPDNEYYSWYEKGHLNKIQGACDFEKEFLKLASHPALVSKAKEILNTDESLDVFISKFFPMMPNGGISTLMHQDNYYFMGDPKEMVSCAVYLQDTYKENGCLRVAKGSHKKGIVPHNEPSVHEPLIKWISESILEEYEVVDFEIPAPYAVFFDINSIHGCYQNNSNSTRYSLAWEYVRSSNNNFMQANHLSFDRNRTINYE